MSSMIIDERDVRFVLFEQLNVEELCDLSFYREYSREMFEMVLKETHRVAEKMHECNRDGDNPGAQWEDGKVILPESFHETYELYREGGWISPCEPEKHGGQALPLAVGAAVMEMFAAANFALVCLPNLTHGAGRLIQLSGTEEQKRLFMDRMYAGQWSGTMSITEAGAGSDVGAIKTKAVRNPNGTYSITGSKIFISFGEQDATENIIHAVLARIEGDPPGAKGLSVFLVPKIKVDEKGHLLEPNDVYCSKIEEKMGLHGSPTCVLNFGDNGNCTGYLLGEEREGIKIMFLMMNEARFYIGMQGQGLTTVSFLHALKFAKERFQGVHITDKRAVDGSQVPIIDHPDIRRTLLTMKAYSEGGRTIMYFTAKCMDLERAAETKEEREKYKSWVNLLIPICKGYLTDRAMEMTSEGVQVHGGYGYCSDYPVEQFMRDCKIASLYEGTNGIHAMDLISRKLGMKGGAVFLEFITHMDEVINTAKQNKRLKGYADLLAQVRDQLARVPMLFDKEIQGGQVQLPYLNATQFMHAFGDVCFAWALLWQANIADEKLEAIRQMAGSANDKIKESLIQHSRDAAFYAGKLAVARHFISNVLPVTRGRINAINNEEQAAWDIAVESFL
jgi:alkylation response protein AidB-like acyl-CoA dehydrogenase